VNMNKKERLLALKHALSAKQKEGSLIVIDSAQVKEAKTKKMADSFKKNGWTAPLFIDTNIDEQFAKAARNIKHVDVLPTAGANVYDILRHKQLILTKDALAHLEKRFA